MALMADTAPKTHVRVEVQLDGHESAYLYFHRVPVAGERFECGDHAPEGWPQETFEVRGVVWDFQPQDEYAVAHALRVIVVST